MSLQWQILNLDQASIGVPITAANVKDHLKMSVFSTVRRLRIQRATAVQASSQYNYIYHFVDTWLTQKIKATKFVEKSNEFKCKE